MPIFRSFTENVKLKKGQESRRPAAARVIGVHRRRLGQGFIRAQPRLGAKALSERSPAGFGGRTLGQSFLPVPV